MDIIGLPALLYCISFSISSTTGDHIRVITSLRPNALHNTSVTHPPADRSNISFLFPGNEVITSIKDGMDPGDGDSFQERHPSGLRESAERHLTLLILV